MGNVQERRGCANESGASVCSDWINTVIRAATRGRASEEEHPATQEYSTNTLNVLSEGVRAHVQTCGPESPRAARWL